MKRILLAVLVAIALLIPSAATASTPADVQLPMLEPVPHEQLAEAGLSPAGVMAVGFALAAVCLGCITVLAARRAILDRKHRFREQRRRPSIGQHFATPPLYRRRT